MKSQCPHKISDKPSTLHTRAHMHHIGALTSQRRHGNSTVPCIHPMNQQIPLGNTLKHLNFIRGLPHGFPMTRNNSSFVRANQRCICFITGPLKFRAHMPQTRAGPRTRNSRKIEHSCIFQFFHHHSSPIIALSISSQPDSSARISAIISATVRSTAGL